MEVRFEFVGDLDSRPTKSYMRAGDGNRTRVASLEVLYAPEHGFGTALAVASAVTDKNLS